MAHQFGYVDAVRFVNPVFVIAADNGEDFMLDRVKKIDTLFKLFHRRVTACVGIADAGRYCGVHQVAVKHTIAIRRVFNIFQLIQNRFEVARHIADMEIGKRMNLYLLDVRCQVCLDSLQTVTASLFLLRILHLT